MRLARFICVICRQRYKFPGRNGQAIREEVERQGHRVSVDGVERQGRILCLRCDHLHGTPRGRLLLMWRAKVERAAHETKCPSEK